jgi:ferredoxin-NADP reductase
MINTYDAHFVSKTELAPNIYKLTFKLSEELIFKAGQYLIFMIPHEDKLIRRLYSIASPHFHTQGVDIIAHIIEGGIASTRFATLSEGDVLQVQGPAGVFTLRENARPKMFLATGTGIAPILSILQSTLTESGEAAPRMMLFWGLRTKSDAYYVDELNGLVARYPSLDVRICLSRESADTLEGISDIYMPGRIDSVLSNHILVHPSVLNNINNLDYYLCGSVAAVDTFNTILANVSVDKSHIYFEKFV